MFNIDEFISSVNQQGVLKTNRYVVEFAMPQYMQNKFDSASRLVSLRCENAVLPGMSFASLNNVPRFGYGAPETIPYGVLFDDFSLSFVLDRKANIHKFFYEWSNSIVNYKSRGQTAQDRGGPANMYVYEVGYKDKYCTDIKIHLYDTDDTKVLTATCYRSYPKNIPHSNLGWSSNDELLKLNIDFSCTDFDIRYIKSDLNLTLTMINEDGTTVVVSGPVGQNNEE